MGIDVIGIGLDGSAGLSPTCQERIAQASLLAGHHRHLSHFAHDPTPQLVLDGLSANLEKLQTAVQTHEHIVVLTSGDPLFFGLGRLLLNHFPKDQLHFYPHLSSIQLAFSRIKQPWQNAQLFSAHGRSLEPLASLLQQGQAPIAILTDPHNTPQAIARFYRGLDLPTAYDFWLCENLGGADERVQHLPAAALEKLLTLSEKDCEPLSVVILTRPESETAATINPANLPLIGIPDRDFLSFADRPGLMTKREIRLLALGELALQPQQVIWDIGAGTGAMSIEIARLCPTAKVYAIEKTAAGIQLIKQNCDRFEVSNVHPIPGTAPKVLATLPVPHRIFLGGSGGYLSDILATCHGRLFVNGSMVLAIATVEHLNESLGWFTQNNWTYRLLQVQLSRSVPLNHLTRLTPLNPITLISAQRSQKDDY